MFGQFENSQPADAKEWRFEPFARCIPLLILQPAPRGECVPRDLAVTFYETVSFISVVSAPRVKDFKDLPL